VPFIQVHIDDWRLIRPTVTVHQHEIREPVLLFLLSENRHFDYWSRAAGETVFPVLSASCLYLICVFICVKKKVSTIIGFILTAVRAGHAVEFKNAVKVELEKNSDSALAVEGWFSSYHVALTILSAFWAFYFLMTMLLMWAAYCVRIIL
jgi:hypothetical protein